VISVAGFYKSAVPMHCTNFADVQKPVIFVATTAFRDSSSGVDDDLGRNIRYERYLAHEVGHKLGLSTRGTKELNPTRAYHDNGKYPGGTFSLMWNLPGDLSPGMGRWLRHEDFIKANTFAERLRP
jgi:hypothetical protein